MINPNFVIVAVLLHFIGGLSYLIDTLKGKIKPNKVSWFLWMLAPAIAFAAEIKQGVGIASLTTFIVAFVPLLVFTASFLNKEAEWKLTAFDLTCGALSILGLILWLITRVGNVAIFFSILADGLASIPTVVKAYQDPESENYVLFFLQLFNAGIALLVIPEWNFQNYAFPFYLLLNGLFLFVLIKFKIGKVLSSKK